MMKKTTKANTLKENQRYFNHFYAQILASNCRYYNFVAQTINSGFYLAHPINECLGPFQEMPLVIIHSVDFVNSSSIV